LYYVNDLLTIAIKFLIYKIEDYSQNSVIIFEKGEIFINKIYPYENIKYKCIAMLLAIC